MTLPSGYDFINHFMFEPQCAIDELNVERQKNINTEFQSPISIDTMTRRHVEDRIRNIIIQPFEYVAHNILLGLCLRLPAIASDSLETVFPN